MTVSSVSGAEKAECPHINQYKTHLHTIYKNKLKIAQRLKYKT